MNKDGKRQFIEELMATIKAELLGKVDVMPEEWDGVEIRQLAADTIAESVRAMDKSRKVKYRTAVISKNL